LFCYLRSFAGCIACKTCACAVRRLSRAGGCQTMSKHCVCLLQLRDKEVLANWRRYRASLARLT
jgi:hypothetical protein